MRVQAARHFFVKDILRSPIYSFYMTVPDAEEQIVAHVQSAINNDVIRIQLQDFLDNEATER